ncbi:MAG TPA: ABC transporter permease [Myxococcales bacterium]|nr:ABC transporter permease [Myxococcales bacterium]
MLLHDLKAAVRSLKRSPGVTAAALISLGLGIAVCSAVFSLIEAVLIQPLPFPSQERLVFATETAGAERSLNAVSGPDLVDMRARVRSFEALGGFHRTTFTLTGLGAAERIDAAALESGVFSALRIPPVRGRAFDAPDDAAGAPRVAVLSHAFWKTRLGGAESAVGSSITLDGQPFTVVGVMPPDFRFPLDGPAAALWVQPRAAPFGNMLGERALFFYQLVGRLRAGATVEQARGELATIVSAISAAHPESHPHRSAFVVPLREQVVGRDRGALLLLLGAVGLLLLIACANVGSLLLARAMARRHDLAVRAALGASKRQLFRQLLIESAVLGLAGGALGLCVCAVSIDAFAQLLPAEVPRLRPITLDAGVLVFGIAISLLATLVCGTAPALLLSNAGAGEILRASQGAPARGTRLRSVLVIAEVALALALLVSATLFGRSLLSVQRVEAGVSTAGLQVVRFTLPEARYPEAGQRRFVETLVARTAAIPGVTGVAAASPLPVGGHGLGLTVTPLDHPEPNPPQSDFFALSPGALGLLGVRIERGREFAAEDRAEGRPVVVINETLARRLWPAEDPIGKRIGLGPGDPASREVIGLVHEVRQVLDVAPGPQIYAPFAQVPWPFTTLIVRSALAPATLHHALRAEVDAIDSDLPVDVPRTIDSILAGTVARRQFSTLVLSAFAGAALLLALLGINGTLAYLVAQRTREMGVRLALGAQRRQVLLLVLRDGLRLTGAGIVLGLAVAWASSRALSSQLFGVSATDPLTYAAVSLALLAAAVLATLLPAWRATRVDPMVALRAE